MLLVQLQLSVVVLANNVPPKAATNKPKRAPKTSPAEVNLSFDHYDVTCPNLEDIIHRKVQAWVNRDKTLAPSLIRLHFHDCVVRVITIIIS